MTSSATADRGEGIEKAYVGLDEGQLHLARRRGSEPRAPIVFIHKTVSTYRMWLPVIAELPADRDMIAFDTPGFGESFDPPGEVEIADYARWIGQAMERLGLPRAHLVGHHTGAAIAMQVAVDRPDLVLSCGLIGPLPLDEQERAQSAVKYGTPFSPRAGGGHMLDALEYIRSAGAYTLELQNREMSAMLRSWQHRTWAYNAVWRQDFGALMKAATMPLALQCSPDDSLWPLFDRACAIRPDALRHELPSGGINYQTDYFPREVAEGVARQIAMAEAQA